MSQNLHEIDLDTFQCDVFHMFGKATPLLTAGDRASFNAMTIGWGRTLHAWESPFVQFMSVLSATHMNLWNNMILLPYLFLVLTTKKRWRSVVRKAEEMLIKSQSVR